MAGAKSLRDIDEVVMSRSRIDVEGFLGDTRDVAGGKGVTAVSHIEAKAVDPRLINRRIEVRHARRECQVLRADRVDGAKTFDRAAIVVGGDRDRFLN